MPVAELQERVEKELAENPVLEVEEGDATLPAQESETSTDASIDDKELVIDNDTDNKDDFERLMDLDREIPDHFDGQRPSANRIQEASSRAHDAISNIVARNETLQDHLVAQLGELELDEPTLRMCVRIISFLAPEEGGYLRASLEDLLPPNSDDQDREMAEHSLKIVQSLDPIGVGARNLKECLLIQIDDTDPYASEMRGLIENHLEDLRDNKIPLICKQTGFDIETIKAAVDQMRTLNPNPAGDFVEQTAPSVTPDVWIVQKDDGTYEVKIEESETPSLFISNYYRKRVANGEATAEEKEFIRKKVTAAQWLIESIEQRRSTLRRVTEAIVAHQTKFLDYGPEFLEPLKMQQIADIVKVHVTTVSRAVDDKWAETPRGIIPLKRFFVGGTVNDSGEEVAWDKIRVKLKELVDSEDKSKPYSDDELVNRLKAQGLKVARRTVTKYRMKMDIPSSRKRRVYTD